MIFATGYPIRLGKGSVGKLDSTVKKETEESADVHRQMTWILRRISSECLILMLRFVVAAEVQSR